jgi:hypothetical protein
MGKKEFTAKCKEVMASTGLTPAEKEAEIKHLSVDLIEDIFPTTPEMRDWRRREAAAIKIQAGHGGFSYCRESGEWYPRRPPVIRAFDREYEQIFNRKVAETCREVLSGTVA